MIDREQMSKIEVNRKLGRSFFLEQDRLRGGPAPELCAPSYRAHLGGNPPTNRDGHEAFAKAFYAAFEDMQHDIERVIADDNSAAVRFVLRGTHVAPFFGIPPTHKRVTVSANVILLLDEGKVTELFGIFDEAGLLRQLGVLPAS